MQMNKSNLTLFQVKHLSYRQKQIYGRLKGGCDQGCKLLVT